MMTTLKRPLFAVAGLLLGLSATNALAAGSAPLFPIKPLIAEPGVDEVYPSAAGNFIVYDRHKSGKYSVVQVSATVPGTVKNEIAPDVLGEAVRYGVAIADGSIGYVSSRLGPISAWMKQAHGDGHVAIANMATFRGALAPQHLNASRDGSIWCFDSTLEKKRYNELLNEFGDATHWEVIGQNWRIYDSNNFRYKIGYVPTKTGERNKFSPPALFVFDRSSSQLTMLPGAFDGAISPSGTQIAFVRQDKGNYNIWVQNLDGSGLTQLTNSEYGEFEPAWSPDGSRIAFISNQDSKGDVRATSVYVMDMKNFRVQRITSGAKASDGGVTWKDEHTLLFHSNRDPKNPQGGTVDDWNIWQVSIR